MRGVPIAEFVVNSTLNKERVRLAAGAMSSRLLRPAINRNTNMKKIQTSLVLGLLLTLAADLTPSAQAAVNRTELRAQIRTRLLAAISRFSSPPGKVAAAVNEVSESQKVKNAVTAAAAQSGATAESVAKAAFVAAGGDAASSETIADIVEAATTAAPESAAAIAAVAAAAFPSQSAAIIAAAIAGAPNAQAAIQAAVQSQTAEAQGHPGNSGPGKGKKHKNGNGPFGNTPPNNSNIDGKPRTSPH